jgi:hypothetical protein
MVASEKFGEFVSDTAGSASDEGRGSVHKVTVERVRIRDCKLKCERESLGAGQRVGRKGMGNSLHRHSCTTRRQCKSVGLHKSDTKVHT